MSPSKLLSHCFLITVFILFGFLFAIPTFAADCNPDIDTGCDDSDNGGGNQTTTVSVNIYGTSPGNINWQIIPGPPHSGNGNGSIYVGGNASYTISNLSFAGCSSYSVTNSSGSGPSMYVPMGTGRSFSVTYSGCAPTPPAIPIADIKADGSDGALTNDGNYRVVSKAAGSVQISWNSTDATSCSYSSVSSGVFGSGLSPNGSATHGNLNGVYVVTLTCNGSGGSASDVIVLNMGNYTPSVDLKADAIGFSSGSACLGSGSDIVGMQGPVTLDAYDPPGCDPYTFPQVNGSRPAGLFKFHYTQSAANSCTLKREAQLPTYPEISQALGNVSYYENSASYFAPGSDNFWWDEYPGSYTMSVTCAGPLGTVSDTLNINVLPKAVPPPGAIPDYENPDGDTGSGPTVDVSASPSAVDSGASATVSWTTTNNPTSCTASASPVNAQWSGSKSPLGGSVTITNLTQATTFSLQCSNPSGTATDAATVTINSPKIAPVVDLYALPLRINAGMSTRLTWVVSGGTATSCTASPMPGNPAHPQWNGAKAATGGSQIVDNIIDSTDFRIRCSNTYGTSPYAMASVIVTSDPEFSSFSLNANPTSVVSGGSTNLTWEVLNADSCVTSATPANAQWTGSITPADGNKTITNLTQTTTFWLECGNANGSNPIGKTVTVTSSTANISVSSNISTSWSGTPSTISGGPGTSGNYTVTPAAGGTSYTLAPNAIPNYSVAVSHTKNGGSSTSGGTVTVSPGDSIAYTITYTPTGPAFDYSLSNPANLSVTKSSSDVVVQRTITKTLTQGTSQSVTLTATGHPSGVSVGYDSNRSCNPTCSSNISFTVSPSAPTGTFAITVTGTSLGVADKTRNFNLTIDPPLADLVVTTSVSKATGRVGEVITWTCNASGGTGSYTYSWTGTDFPSPLPTTSSVNITYQTVGTKTGSCTVDDGNQVVSSLSPKQVIISVNPIFEEF